MARNRDRHPFRLHQSDMTDGTFGCSCAGNLLFRYWHMAHFEHEDISKGHRPKDGFVAGPHGGTPPGCDRRRADYAQINAQISTSIILMAIGSALSLVVIEFIYVAKRVISPIYLADAIAELILIGWWVLDTVLS